MLRVEYALTSDRTMKALTGLTRPEFRALVPAFGQALYDQALQRDPPRQRRPGGGGPATLKTAEAKLFFLLIYVKCYPTFDVAAVLYGVHRSRAHRWTQDLLPVLEQTLGYQMILPERQIHEVEGFFQRVPTAQTLFVDGSERPTYRPQERLAQKTYYSGKKNDIPVNTSSSAMSNGVYWPFLLRHRAPIMTIRCSRPGLHPIGYPTTSSIGPMPVFKGYAPTILSVPSSNPRRNHPARNSTSWIVGATHSGPEFASLSNMPLAASNALERWRRSIEIGAPISRIDSP